MPKKAQRWEYRVMYGVISEAPNVDALNIEGQEGWELISVTVVERRFWYFFKRSIQRGSQR